ncbi:hypothetical protein [Arcobacter sp. FWKO B]|uniref:hypothetical protein n=1 Tax=Arcobacter sp. FWKO B TaxID=2593672 RepID=UPI0018A60D42|nr:hypothetical protein [Arcobacter sp. FWKO B]QOG11431.1 hypothetical protein FWKOB_01410 [Arcobacter sp. FWKO B]
MEVGSITQNVNSTVPLVNPSDSQLSSQVQKTQSAVLHKDKDAAVVTLSQTLDNRKSGIFENVSMLNNTFAITQIAQKGLDKQEEILKKMENVILADNETKSVDVKKSELIDLVKDFNKSIQNTRFNNEMLLTTEKSFEEITMVTNDDTFFIQTPDMQSTMENIAKIVVKYDGSVDTNEKLAQEINKGLENINNYSNTYDSVQKHITSNPLSNLIPNFDTSNLNANTLFVDFGKDMTDFNKTNITSQLGYLAAAQANILQEHTSKLLV